MMRSSRNALSEDASRFTHGAVYHALYDRPLAEARRRVVDSIPKGATVLDVGCGTGQLCLELRARKECQVTGIDLSRRMIAFAEKRNGFDNVRFVHGDGSDLEGLEQGAFDYATVLFLLHEVPRRKQINVLNEASRVARRVIAVDSQVPLPRNAHGIALRLVEAIGGPEHYRSFADYLGAGGISGILSDEGVRVSVTQRSIFWHGCRDIVVLESGSTASS
ncbi:class I SAM-dependent methyltransferase [Candidatus Fermentibacteria bacterium]|nr:class I SAM-dependent methyltransferase [Candidatus Fermentibacteria bacterium]